MGMIMRRAVLTVVVALFSWPITAQAFICNEQKIVAISMCQEDLCFGGFKTENLPLKYCKTRPVVRELTDGERVNLSAIIERFEQETPNGIYQVRTYARCLRDGWHENCESRPSLRDDLTDEERAAWRDAMQRSAQGTPEEVARAWAYPSCTQYGYQDERCLAEGTVARLADAGDPQVLAQLRTEWLAKERDLRLAIMIRPWRNAILMGLATLLLLAWPWLLVSLKASLERFVVHTSVAAIPGQALAVLWFELYRHPPFDPITGEPVEWPQLALICETLILLFVPLQFGCLILQKLKPEALHSVKTTAKILLFVPLRFGYLILQKLKPEALPPIKTTANVILLFGTCTVLAWATMGAIHFLARLSLGTAG